MKRITYCLIGWGILIAAVLVATWWWALLGMDKEVGAAVYISVGVLGIPLFAATLISVGP